MPKSSSIACPERSRRVNRKSLALSACPSGRTFWVNPEFCRRAVEGLIVNKASKFLSIVTCQLSIVFVLSGCSAIGVNKPAALQVTSTPEASVFLDGKHLGKTPFFSDQLKAGEHELKITEGSASFSSKINLQSSTLTVVNRQLAKNFLSQSGEILTLDSNQNGLFIIAYPQNAEITVDGKLQGESPILIENIEEGEHKVSASKQGYITSEFTVKTTKKYQLLAEITLASEIAKQMASEDAPEIKSIKVEILKAPATSLKIRQEPISTSLEIGSVKIGEEYEVLQEISDWLKIIFDGQQGWIQSRYTKKLP